MNITDQLESIMHKVSDGFPAFGGGYLKAKQLIRQYFRGLPPNACVLLVGSQETDVEHIGYLMGEGQEYKSLVIDTFNDEKIDLSTVGDFDKILIVSYFAMPELSHALNLLGIEFECLYDYFVLNGLVLQYNWYDYIMAKYWDHSTSTTSHDFRCCTGYRELYYVRKRYGCVKDATLKAFHLRRMIFICLHMRDFIYAKRYIDEYVAKGYANAEHLTSVWDEVAALLEHVKSALSHRTDRDTVMFWLDALEYGYDKDMPFFNGLKEHTLVFENAFTVTPYTDSTLRTILTGKKEIDDKAYRITDISEENSRFIRVLKDNGVDFVFCTSRIKCINKAYRLRVPLPTDAPTGTAFWSAMEKLLSCQRPVCLVAHECNNSHNPYISSANDADKLFCGEDFQCASKQDWAAVDRQRVESLAYLDEQLTFYSALLPSAVTKIYFSDHGQTVNCKHHSCLKINGDKIQSQTVHDIFSYVDWHKLITWLYDPEKQPFESLFREYAEIQDIDYCNGVLIKKELTGKDNFGMMKLLSHRGIVTRDEVLILRSDGFECFYNREANRPPISPTRLDELRQLCGNYFIDPFSDDTFKCSRYLYRAIDNYLKRTGSYEHDKTEAIRKLFTTDKTIAIRTGAKAAFQLLLRLAPDLHQNVKYIIDRNPDCVAAKFGGIEVIDVDRARQLDIDMVIMPTFRWRGLLKTECYGKAQIIDLTDYLAELGFSQQKEFWEYNLTAEDVNFDMED